MVSCGGGLECHMGEDWKSGCQEVRKSGDRQAWSLECDLGMMFSLDMR